VIHLVLAQVLAWTPATSASTLPRGTRALTLAGGFTALRIDLPALPVFPVLTGDAEVAWGVGARVDLRVRYSTHLGFIHRLGPELRVTAARAGGWSFGARLHPSAQFAGSFQSGVEYGGDVATLVGLVGSYRWGSGAVTVDAGLTVDWLVYEHFTDRTTVDDRPYLASGDVGLTVEWPVREGQSLVLRAEAHVPTAPDDPSTVGGVVPRVVFGGVFWL
jgi:hypothetical protein